jgi:hypothetical protein
LILWLSKGFFSKPIKKHGSTTHSITMPYVFTSWYNMKDIEIKQDHRVQETLVGLKKPVE